MRAERGARTTHMERQKAQTKTNQIKQVASVGGPPRPPLSPSLFAIIVCLHPTYVLHPASSTAAAGHRALPPWQPPTLCLLARVVHLCAPPWPGAPGSQPGIDGPLDLDVSLCPAATARPFVHRRIGQRHLTPSGFSHALPPWPAPFALRPLKPCVSDGVVKLCWVLRSLPARSRC